MLSSCLLSFVSPVYSPGFNAPYCPHHPHALCFLKSSLCMMSPCSPVVCVLPCLFSVCPVYFQQSLLSPYCWASCRTEGGHANGSVLAQPTVGSANCSNPGTSQHQTKVEQGRRRETGLVHELQEGIFQGKGENHFHVFQSQSKQVGGERGNQYYW